MKEIDGIIYSTDGSELADWLTLKLSTTTQLRQRGTLPPLEKGKGYPMRESIAAYIGYLRERAQKGRPPGDSSGTPDVKEQILIEKLRKEKRLNDEADKLLINVESVIKIINELIGIIRPRLEGLPGQVQRFSPGGRAAEITKREIAKITKAIADIDVMAILDQCEGVESEQE